jgi:hypothetical protein
VRAVTGKGGLAPYQFVDSKNGLRAISHIEFYEEVLQVRFNGIHRCIKSVRNFFIGHAFLQGMEKLKRAGTELHGHVSRKAPWSTQSQRAAQQL